MKYKWGKSFFSADANKVGEELDELGAREDLTREGILDYARENKKSELNKCFEWDDTIAGEKYRLHQASLILTSISIVTKEETDKEPEKTVRAFVNVKEEEQEKRVYKNIVTVLNDENEYQQLVKKAREDINRCKQTYENVIEIKDLKDILFDIYKSI